MELLKDRHEAGRLLAEIISEKLQGERDICVLALPRGGVPVGWEVAHTLNCPLDVLFVKKIGAPGQPELAIGAVSEGGKVIWQQETVDWLKISADQLKELASNKQNELKAQVNKWRKDRTVTDVKDKTVVVVDDGLATGATMIAALRVLRKKSPRKIMVAVPVSSENAKRLVTEFCDEMVILETPQPFFAVGQWYVDFTQVTDEEVRNLLEMDPKRRPDTNLGDHEVLIPCDDLLLEGELIVPDKAKGLIIFAHGSGSSHSSPRNQKVAKAFNQLGFATLLFDLLTPDEAKDRPNAFNIPLLMERLKTATRWAMEKEDLSSLPVGYFGSDTGAAAALAAAARQPLVKSIVSRGGRLDLADNFLKDVQAKVLLIVPGAEPGALEQNDRARDGLYACEKAVIENARHLFEEENAMDDVIEYASNWFNQTLLISGEAGITPYPNKQVVEDVERLLQPLTSGGIDALARSLSDARVVMLGEATHGSEEFYKFRRLISERLIEDHGFKFIAVEGDWPDCYKLNHYIQTGEGGNARDIMKQFSRWPTWMWANDQTKILVEWMRGKNAGFYGLDVYSLYDSIDVVKRYAQKLVPDLRQRVLEAYSCFESFDNDEIAYSRSLAKFPSGCESEALDALRRLLRLRLEESSLQREELFDAQQNAKIIRNGERYYRAVLQGESESWNIRDEHMLETLMALLQKYDDGAKAIVWAHNTHIGDYHATDMREAGYVNLGGLAREKIGMENVKLVGFGTHHGEVLAGRAWDAQPEAMNLPPAAPGSYEDYFHKVAKDIEIEDYFLPLRNIPSLSIKKGHRAVGVVYQTIFEQHGKNYVPTELSKRYDAFVYIDKTSALKAFPRPRDRGLLPETWPSGT